MISRTLLQLLTDAATRTLPQDEAESTEWYLRDLIASLEHAADELDLYAVSKASQSIDQSRENTAKAAASALLALRVAGL